MKNLVLKLNNYNINWILLSLIILINSIYCIQLFLLNKFLEAKILDWYLLEAMLNITRISIKNFNLSTTFFFDNSNLNALFGGNPYSFPYAIRTPDVVLLLLVSNHVFLFIHTILILTLAILGLNKLCDYLHFNISARIFLMLIWFFNGALIGRYSVGHLQLYGYLFIPFFIYLILSSNKQNLNVKSMSWKFATFLSFLLLLGSMHVWFQMILFMSLISIFIKRRRAMYVISIIKSFLLSAWIIIPTFFSSNYMLPNIINTREVGVGYGWRYFNNPPYVFLDKDGLGLRIDINAILFHVKEIFFQITHALFNFNMLIEDASWEWSLYSGPFFLVVCTFLILYLVIAVSNKTKFFSKDAFSIELLSNDFYVMIVTSFLLGISINYRAIYLLFQRIFENIPIIDRIPYRSLLYTYAGLIVIITIFANNLMQRSVIFKYFFTAGFTLNFIFLLANVKNWNLQKLSEIPGSGEMNSASEQFQIQNGGWGAYTTLLFSMMFISLMSYIYWFKTNLISRKL